MSRIGRGDWRPPTLAGGHIALILGVLTITSVVRSLDYSTGRDGTRVVAEGPQVVAGIEESLPGGLITWSVLLGMGAAALIAGMVGRWRSVVWAGHSLLGGCYAALSVGVIIESLSVPYLDGIRTGGLLLLPALLHAQLSWATAPWRWGVPVDQDHSGEH